MNNNKYFTKPDKCGVQSVFFLGASVFLFGFPGGGFFGEGWLAFRECFQSEGFKVIHDFKALT